MLCSSLSVTTLFVNKRCIRLKSEVFSLKPTALTSKLPTCISLECCNRPYNPHLIGDKLDRQVYQERLCLKSSRIWSATNGGLRGELSHGADRLRNIDIHGELPHTFAYTTSPETNIQSINT